MEAATTRTLLTGSSGEARMVAAPLQASGSPSPVVLAEAQNRGEENYGKAAS